MEKINEKNFNEFIGSGLAIVDFFANWCGPCKMLSPILEEVANENPDVKIAKLDVDESVVIAINNKVDVIPTLIVYKDGKQVDKQVGLLSKQELQELINKNK